jgi:hypothetical protein
MRMPTWRIALSGAAVVTLAAVGIGLALASSAPATTPPSAIEAVGTPAPGSTARPDRRFGQDGSDRQGRAGPGPRLLRLGRHLVHAEATVTDKDGKLVTLWFDHGTVARAGNGSLTIAETGGGMETISTDDATIVRIGRTEGSLNDVTAGDEVFVQSRVLNGLPAAKRILILPARPDAPAAS